MGIFCYRMEERAGVRKKGFTLFETLIAALVLTIVGSAIAGIYVFEGAMLLQASHRLEAINYARSAAERLLQYEGSTSLGIHNEGTDPGICRLPKSYFKTDLK